MKKKGGKKNAVSSSRNTDLNRIMQQNEVIITLLGRVAFKEEEIRQIVERKKKNPKKYVEAYNACDGEHTVSRLAEIAKVSQPNMTNVLKLWKESCIIYEVERPKGKFYKKLFAI